MDDTISSKKTIKSIMKVAISNIVKLLSGVLVGFLIPKIIGVTDYGYYKIFTLYAGYVGLFHLGFNDGIYLKFGGMDYDELPKSSFKLYTKFLMTIEIIISLIAMIICLFFLEGQYKFIFAALAIYLIFFNVTGYYQIISQITGRFNELSFRNLIESIFIIVSVLSLYLLYKFTNIVINYNLYVCIYIMIYAVLSFWYIFTYRDITFGRNEKIVNKLPELFSYIRLGVPLLIANLCSSLILTLDRQFVSILWPVEETNTYSMYAFAYNMMSLVTTALAAISTVIYPTLKKTSDEAIKNNYSKLIAVLLTFSSLCMISYYPLCFIVKNILPQYIDSIKIFRLVFPSIIISSAVTIVMHNYYKVQNQSFKYFIKSIIILVISFLFNLIAYLLFKTPESISIASIITLLIWYVLAERYLVRTYGCKWLKNLLYMMVSIISFYLVTFIDNIYLGFATHILAWILVTFIFYGMEIKQIYNSIKNRRKK